TPPAGGPGLLSKSGIIETYPRSCLQSGMTQEATECGQVHHVEERTGELVVACGDGPVDLQMTDQALDVVALPIEALVPTDRRLAVRTRRDHRPDADIA